MYPVTIIKTRYQGTYEGALWAAFNSHPEQIPIAATGDDFTCAAWWEYASNNVGRGNNPEAAYADLEARIKGYA